MQHGSLASSSTPPGGRSRNTSTYWGTNPVERTTGAGQYSNAIQASSMGTTHSRFHPPFVQITCSPAAANTPAARKTMTIIRIGQPDNLSGGITVSRMRYGISGNWNDHWYT